MRNVANNWFFGFYPRTGPATQDGMGFYFFFTLAGRSVGLTRA